MSIKRVTLIAALLAAICPAHSQEAAKPPGFTVEPIIVFEDQSPADFLDLVGKSTKARWRLLFRPQPPTPPTDRARAALILGSLIGESFLIWQASDSQQFRNNNQDIVTYCRMLGVGEKLMPRLMAQGKMSEASQWKELRQEIHDSHEELLRLLRALKDDDLTLLIDTGLWLRMLEIASTVITDTPGADVRGLCVGSPSTLQDMRDRFARITAKQREEALLKNIHKTLEEISATWKDAATIPPTQAAVAKTNESLKALMQSVMEK